MVHSTVLHKVSYFNNPTEGNPQTVSDDYVAVGREVVSKTSAYNITKLSYRVEVRVWYDANSL